MALSGIKAGIHEGRKSVEEFKKNFFDAPAIVAEMDKATRKALSKFGAFVRRRSQTSIRYRVKISDPGQPPSGHRTMTRKKTNRKTGMTKVQTVSPLRDFILFAYDAEAQTAIIGPALLNGKTASAGNTIPEALEHSGTMDLLEALRHGQWSQVFDAEAAKRKGRAVRKRTARVRARPFMNPALEAELPKLPEMYENAF